MTVLGQMIIKGGTIKGVVRRHVGSVAGGLGLWGFRKRGQTIAGWGEQKSIEFIQKRECRFAAQRACLGETNPSCQKHPYQKRHKGEEKYSENMGA